MDAQSIMRKFQDIASALTFSALLILAVVFYRERTLFLDAAYILFCLAKDGALAVQNYRFGVIPVQAFTLLFIKLKLPIQAVMISYSVAFILFHWACQLLIRYGIKDREMALLHLLLQVVMVSGTFFWTPSEQFLGLSLMLVYFAYARQWNARPKGVGSWAILFLLQLTLVFMHPLLFIPFGFLSVFFVLQNEDFRSASSREWVFGLMLFGVLLVIKSLFFRHPYDVGAMSNLKHFVTQFPDYYHLNSNRQFLSALPSRYYLLPVIGLLLLRYFYQTGQRFQALWWGISALAYFLLVNVSYMDGAHDFYLESHYQTLSLIFLTPLVLLVFPTLTLRKVQAFLVVVLLLRLIQLPLNAGPFTQRVQWLESRWEQMEKENQFKILATEQSVPMKILMLSWATPYEFWLISEERMKPIRSLVVQEKAGELQWAAGEKHGFVTRWGVFPYREMPDTYFHFTDTGVYRIIP